MSENLITNFSLISRLFGNLFHRMPTDPVLENVFNWLQQKGLQQKGLQQVWALHTDNESERAIADVQMLIKPAMLEEEYLALFSIDGGKVPMHMAAYDLDEQAFLAFRQERGMSELTDPVDFGLVLLTASWIEDNLNSTAAQAELFELYLLPYASKFLSKVESAATLPFYRSLALLTREILAATADELDETQSQA